MERLKEQRQKKWFIFYLWICQYLNECYYDLDMQNEASENSRKEGYKSNRTRHTTITDSPGEIKDNTGEEREREREKMIAIVRIEKKARVIFRIRR